MNEPMWDKLLPEPLPEPYRRAYTLVINLDETLVKSTWDVSIKLISSVEKILNYFCTAERTWLETCQETWCRLLPLLPFSILRNCYFHLSIFYGMAKSSK